MGNCPGGEVPWWGISLVGRCPSGEMPYSGELP